MAKPPATVTRNTRHIVDPDEVFLYLTERKYSANAKANHKRSIRRVAARNYKLQDGSLWYKVITTPKPDIEGTSGSDGAPNQEGDWRKVLREENERNEILHGLHGGKLGGHFGRDKTVARVQKRYWWPTLYEDVVSFIKRCDRCQRVNQKTPNVGNPLHPIPVKTPQAWLSIGIDLIGPLTETPRGNKYICTVTCYYSKMAQAKPLKSKEAVGVGRVLYELFLVFGFPKKLLSDQGREFNNAVVGEITQILKITHRRTSAYHPQCNGLTERYNQTLERQILKLQNDDKNDWDDLLPDCVFAYNTSLHASTGFQPFYLMFGREPIEPEDVQNTDEEMEEIQTAETSTSTEIAARVTRMRSAVGEKAMANIQAAQTRQKKNYDKRRCRQDAQQLFQVGALVLKKNNRRADRKRGKQDEPWLGPFTVEKRNDGGTYILSKGGKTSKVGVNACQLKVYNV